MKRNVFGAFVAFVVFIAIAFVGTGLAAYIQAGFGSVEVTTGFFTPEASEAAGGVPVRIAYKLYRPRWASADRPVPAVLAMHGYQNDKDTSGAFAIELARRGVAVLSIDLYGHGDTRPGMRGRGWGRYRINALGNELSGPRRFLLMMTFSVLDFFHPEISYGLADTSMGGRSAWRYLSSLPFVDSSRMGVTGHSMGAWAAWSVAAAFPEHRAIVLQCGEVFSRDMFDYQEIRFNNVLMLQALYEEFEHMRDYRLVVPGLERTPLRYRDFMGQDAPVEWNRTYGFFADGSARRMELLHTNHRLVTFSRDAMTATMDWFGRALEMETDIADTDHVFMIKETLKLIAMLAALASMLPFFLLLARFRFFAPLVRPLSASPKMLSPKSRRLAIIIAILISGLTFPFLTQLGHGLLPLPEDIFRMTIGNGFITWLSFLMIVSLVMLIRWYRKGDGKKTGWAFSDLGLEPGVETQGAGSVTRGGLIVRAIAAAFILTGMVYVLVCISVAVFNLDFRFIWPFFRPFSPLRFGQFLVYLPFFAAFFAVNAGVKLYGQLRLPEIFLNGKKSQALTQLAWWGYSMLVMLGGVVIIALIQYVPFFMGIGPGADILFSPLFGGPFMSILIVLIPQFAVFFFLSTWLYRKSGTIYTGSFVVAILASWALSGGSAVF